MSTDRFRRLRRFPVVRRTNYQLRDTKLALSVKVDATAAARFLRPKRSQGRGGPVAERSRFGARDGATASTGSTSCLPGLCRAAPAASSLLDDASGRASPRDVGGQEVRAILPCCPSAVQFRRATDRPAARGRHAGQPSRRLDRIRHHHHCRRYARNDRPMPELPARTCRVVDRAPACRSAPRRLQLRSKSPTAPLTLYPIPTGRPFFDFEGDPVLDPRPAGVGA